jgi:hypothetical protein
LISSLIVMPDNLPKVLEITSTEPTLSLVTSMVSDISLIGAIKPNSVSCSTKTAAFSKVPDVVCTQNYSSKVITPDIS